MRARYVIGADGANSFVRDGHRHRVRRPGLRGATGSSSTCGPTTSRPCPRSPRRASGATRPVRTCTRATAVRTGASSSCCCRASVPRTSRMRRACGRCWRRGSRPPTGRSCVRRSTSSAAGSRATMRADRALLAGDAAHTMPPFMGQGLCSGVRDAANVAWRLDLILRGLADDRLLDGYTTERRAQNEWIVNLSTEMGRVSCTLDARAAAERDAALRAADAPPPLALPPLQDGTLATGRPLAGEPRRPGPRPHRPPRGPLRRRLRQALRAADPARAAPVGRARGVPGSPRRARDRPAPARRPRRPADRLVRRAPRRGRR